MKKNELFCVCVCLYVCVHECECELVDGGVGVLFSPILAAIFAHFFGPKETKFKIQNLMNPCCALFNFLGFLPRGGTEHRDIRTLDTHGNGREKPQVRISRRRVFPPPSTSDVFVCVRACVQAKKVFPMFVVFRCCTFQFGKYITLEVFVCVRAFKQHVKRKRNLCCLLSVFNNKNPSTGHLTLVVVPKHAMAKTMF